MSRKRRIGVLLVCLGLSIILISYLVMNTTAIESKSFSDTVTCNKPQLLDLGHLESGDRIHYVAHSTCIMIFGITTISESILFELKGNGNYYQILLQCCCGTDVKVFFEVPFAEIYILLVGKWEESMFAVYTVICILLRCPYNKIAQQILFTGISITFSSLLFVLNTKKMKKVPKLKNNREDYIA